MPISRGKTIDELAKEFNKKFKYHGNGKYYYGDVTSRWYANPDNFVAFIHKLLIDARISELEYIMVMIQDFHIKPSKYLDVLHRRIKQIQKGLEK